MLLEQTIDKMMKMKLFGMASSAKDRLSRADHADLSFSELLGFMIDDEWLSRENRRLTSLLKSAKFKEKNACIENIDYHHTRGLKKSTVLELAQNRWINAHQNLAITGPSGVGKSYLAQALGHQACQAGYSVMYLRFPKLLTQLVHARADGSYIQFLARLSKSNLLILDDFGISVLEEAERRDFLEIIEDRYGTGSTIITSQLPISSWHEYLGGGQIGDAICDRLIHNCNRIDLDGESVRKERGGLTSVDRSGK